MSLTLSTVAKREFDTEVKHAYQGAKTLRDTITVRNNVIGDKYDFRTMGKGQATTRTGVSADVVPMNVSHGLKQAVLLDYEAPEYTDVYNAKTVNFDEVQELSYTVGSAMGRRDDQAIIDAMALTTNVLAVTPVLNLGAITGAAQKLNEKDVPMEDRCFVTDEIGLNDLLNDATITSSDYNSVKLLMQGEINTFMGFNWKIVGSGRAEGGLGGNSYAYHKRAVGYAVGIDMKTEVNYIPHKASWLTNGLWKAGAILIDEEGCVKIPRA